MVRGRKPKPTELKKRAGNPGKRKLNDKEPKPGSWPKLKVIEGGKSKTSGKGRKPKAVKGKMKRDSKGRFMKGNKAAARKKPKPKPKAKAEKKRGPGRPPKDNKKEKQKELRSTALKLAMDHMAEAEAADFEAQLEEMKIPEDCPAPPEQMKAEAKIVWYELAPDLVKKNVLTPWDVHSFEVFCDAVGQYRSERRQLALMGDLTLTAAGMFQKNPVHTILRDAISVIDKFGAKFGFSPADRARLAIDTSEEEDPIKAFLEKHNKSA